MKLTGAIASAHSPWPLWRTLICCGSLQICTKSPTAKDCWVRFTLSLTELTVPDVDAAGTLVSTAGLNVHLHKTFQDKIDQFSTRYINTASSSSYSHDRAVSFDHQFRKKEKNYEQNRFTHLLPLGYETTISWSSSIPTTPPVVLKHSNIPSVQPPWPCCNDCTISKSKSTFTC